MSAAPDLPETEAYWAAAAEGRLLVRRCLDCEKAHHYPRSYCPFCASPRTEWLEATGEGRIYSFTVWRRRDGVSAPAFVTLAEGPMMMTEIVDSDFDALAVGAPVRLAPADPARPAPRFRLQSPRPE